MPSSQIQLFATKTVNPSIERAEITMTVCDNSVSLIFKT